MRILLGLVAFALALAAPRAGAQAPTTPAEWTGRAAALQESGDLPAAREAWLRASALLPIGAERDDCVGRAREIELRLALRAEIVADFDADRRLFAEIGVNAADDAGLSIDGGRVPWREVPLGTLRRAAAIARASQRARAGLVLEELARGTKEERETVLADLGRMLERGDIAAADAWSAVARARGERIPARGYVFRDRHWLDADLLAAAADKAGLEGIARRFEAAGPDRRDALLADLGGLGPAATARAGTALEARWTAAVRELERGTSLELLAAIAAQRAELDRRRKASLDLIFDEKRYFYPYDPPACPPEKAKLYAGVQQEVDRLVSAVRETWRASRHARLPADFRSALDEIAWNRERQRERKLAFALPPSIPAWLDGLDAALEEVDLASFAWNARERAALARDRAVAAFNERSWMRGDPDPARAASSEEREQVRVTNEYRRMLGRSVLAWNARIQAAAQGHSEYMADTGDFGHFEKDAARRSPADRMRLQGYLRGGSENCHAGDSGPEGAHVGWVHSSGHHRNILSASHHEMAAAIASYYWTQNFGDGSTEPEQLLDDSPRMR